MSYSVRPIQPERNFPSRFLYPKGESLGSFLRRHFFTLMGVVAIGAFLCVAPEWIRWAQIRFTAGIDYCSSVKIADLPGACQVEEENCSLQLDSALRSVAADQYRTCFPQSR